MTTLAELRQRALSRRLDEEMAKRQQEIDYQHTERVQAGLFYEAMLGELTGPDKLDRAEISPILSVANIDPWHGETNRRGQAIVEFHLNVVDGFPIEFSAWFENSTRQPAAVRGLLSNHNHGWFWFVEGNNDKRKGFAELGDAILFAEEQAIEAAEIAEAEAGYLAEMEAKNA